MYTYVKSHEYIETFEKNLDVSLRRFSENFLKLRVIVRKNFKEYRKKMFAKLIAVLNPGHGFFQTPKKN